jgi:hypothetical protein
MMRRSHSPRARGPSRTMLKLLLAATVALTAVLPAQTCPERLLGVPLGTGDDVMFTMQPIGFAFPFGGTTYTDVHVNCNGYFFLSNANVPPVPTGNGDYSATPAELAAGGPRVAVLWNDLNILAANNASVYIDSTPSRCTITWDNAVNFGLSTLFQVQAQLFPSGEIRMYWSEGATNNSVYNFVAGAGLTGASPGGGALLPQPSDLSASGSTPNDTLYEHWTVQGTFDLPLRSLQLIPTNPGWLYLATAWSGCASTRDYGLGCVDARDSFYELMPASAFDLANTRITMVRTATGYIAGNGGTAAFVTPTLAAAIIANGDDVVQTVQLALPMPVPGGTTQFLTVSSNGNIALAGTGNGAGFAPDANNFLGFAQTAIAAAWHDYNPTFGGSGKVLFEQVGGVAYVTWNNVFSYNTATPDRFQYQFELASGNVAIVYSAMGAAGNEYLVGYSVGGPSVRTIESDLSAELGATIAVADAGVQGLTLSTNGLPLVGNAGFAYTVSLVPAVSPVGILFFGDTATPPIDLGFLGMAGCRGYTNANLATVTFAVAGGSGTQPLPIPGNVALVGTAITAQAVAFSLATQLNLVTSNGNQIAIGL